MTRNVVSGLLRELASLTNLYKNWNARIEVLAQLRGVELLSPDQERVLRWLEQGPLMNRDLLTLTGWLRPHVSQATGPLLAKGYIEKSRKNGTRGLLLEITPSGRATLDSINSVAGDALSEMCPTLVPRYAGRLLGALVNANNVINPSNKTDEVADQQISLFA